MKLRMLLVIITAFIAAYTGCKEAPSVDPSDIFGDPNPGTRPGYNYPYTTAVYPANGATGVPTDTSIVALFNMPVTATSLTYPNIIVEASVARSGTTVNASNVITGLSNTDDLLVGMDVSGAGIPAGATVSAILSSTSVRISVNATADGAATLTFGMELAEGAVNDYEVVAGTNSAEITMNPLTGAGTALSPIPSGFSISLTLTAGITDEATDAIPLNNPGTYAFTVGDGPDEAAPQVLTATASPANGATNVALRAADGLVISIDFDENVDLDSTTINGDTMYLQLDDGGVLTTVPCTYTYDSANKRITLAPAVYLQPDTATTNYVVTVTTGIEDMSGNALALGYSWTFETVTTPLDDVAGNPTITGPTVPAVTQTQAQVSWYTNEPTSHVLNFGRGDDVADDSHTDLLYGLYHTVVLGTDTPALDPGKRYYAQVDQYEDIAGNTGAAAPATPLEFNTITDETEDPVHDGAGAQSGINTIPYTFGTGASGFFSFWGNIPSGFTYSEIYGQFYDYTMAAGWNGASPMGLYTGATYTYRSAAEDGTGGVILVVTSSTGGISAKRVDGSGSLFNWGTGTTTSAGTGFSVDTTVTAAYAVPVYAGMFTKIRTGTPRTEMESMNLLYDFFDYGMDFVATLAAQGAVDEDIIMDETNHDGTTLDNNTDTQDFRHILGQDANIIGVGDTYYIGDASNSTSFTATDHDMNVAGTMTCADDTVYTQNGFSLPGGWTLGVGDIIRNGATYARITAMTAHSTTQLFSGAATVDVASHLIDMGTNFNTQGVGIGDRVRNVEAASPNFEQYANVTAISADGHDLTLSADIFPDANEDYEIYDYMVSGTCDQAAANHLVDSTASFETDGVAVGDIVVDTVNWDEAAVTAVNSQTNLTLSANAFSAGNETYMILDGTLLASGHANGDVPNHLIDMTVNFTTFPTLNSGDMAYCATVSPYYANITNVTANDLTLDADIFPTGTENYVLYNRLDDGAGDRATANLLIDSNVDFTGLGITVNTDLVRNVTDGTHSRIIGVHDGYLELDNGASGEYDDDIFNGTETYQIIHPLYSGTCSIDNLLHDLYDAGIDFVNDYGAQVGDRVYRVANGQYYTISSFHDYFGSNRAMNFSESVQFSNEDYILYDVLSTGNTADNGNASILFDLNSTGGNGWSSLAGLGAGDIVVNLGTNNAAAITSVDSDLSITLNSGIFTTGSENYKILDSTTITGNANGDVTNCLIDMNAVFSGLGIATGSDRALNTDTGDYAVINTVNSNTQLTLSADIFPDGTENYEIYSYIASGTADGDDNFRLIDSTAQFETNGVAVGDIVRNLTDGTQTRVAALGVLSETDLLLEDDFFDTGNESYEILAGAPLETGNANGYWADHLVDFSEDFVTQGIVAGDLVQNIGSGAFAVVAANPNASYPHYLALTDDGIFPSANIFPTGTESYRIFHEWDVADSTNPTGTYYGFTVNWNIGIAGGTANVALYDYLGITGTADTPPPNPLYDNDADFTAGTAVAAGDIAVNLTDFTNPSDPNIATIQSGTYGIRALNLSANIFEDNDAYEILRLNIANTAQSDIVDTGTATGGAGTLTAAGPLWVSGASPLPVQVGDVAYNITDDDYALITAVAESTLTLDRDASFTNGDYYLILRRRGALFVWQESGAVHGRITKMEQSTTMNLRAEFTIAADGLNPQAVSDGLGNAIVVYADSSGEIWAQKINGAGTQVWAPVEIDTQTANAETILDVQTDTAGGAVILYKYNNDLHAQRISAAGVRQWPAVNGNGRTFDNDGATTVTSEETMVYDSATGDVAVVANVGDDIWACRRGATAWAPVMITSLAGSVQQNPQMFLDGADTIVTWDDNRFLSNAGYGVFGVKINGSTGVTDSGWSASASGTTDYNGIAFVLSNYNEYWPNSRIVTYNDGAEAVLFWEDYRVNGEDSNLVFEYLTSFAP